MILNQNTPIMCKFYFLTVFEAQQLWNVRTFNQQEIFQHRGLLWSLLSCKDFKTNFLLTKLINIIVKFGKNQLLAGEWPSFVQDVVDLQPPSLALKIVKNIAEVGISLKGKPLTREMVPAVDLIWKTLTFGLSIQSNQSKFLDNASFPSPPIEGLQHNDIGEAINSAFDAIQQMLDSYTCDNTLCNDTSIDLFLKYSTIDIPTCEISSKSLSTLSTILASPKVSLYLSAILSTLCSVLKICIEDFNRISDEYNSRAIDFARALFSLPFAVKNVDSSQYHNSLQIFYMFTFTQIEESNIISCLQIWESILQSGADVNLENFYLNFLERLSRPCYFIQEELSDASLDLISSISNVYPLSSLTFAYNLFHQKFTEYQQHTDDKDYMERFELSLKIIGRLCYLYSDTHFLLTFESCKFVIVSQSNTLSYIFSNHLQGNHTNRAHLKLAGSIFTCLTLMISWFSTYRSQALDYDVNEEFNCEKMIERLVNDAILYQEKLANFVRPSQFLAKVSSILRPPCLEWHTSQQFLLNLQNNESRVAFKSNLTYAWIFVANLFINSPYGQRFQPQNWNHRATQFHDYLVPVLRNMQDFFTLDMSANPQIVRKGLMESFEILDAIVSATNDGNSHSREVSFFAISKQIALLPRFIPYFTNDEGGLEVLVQVISNSIECFSSLILKSNQIELVSQSLHLLQSIILERPTTLSFVNSAFKLFSLIGQEKSKLYVGELRKLIHFCQELNAKSQPFGGENEIDILINLSDLVTKIIKAHWTYFFGSKVKSVTATSEVDQSIREQEFLALFRVIAMSFVKPEIDLVRQNIKVILDLDKNFHLFEKVFVTLLFQLFVDHFQDQHIYPVALWSA